MPKKKPTFMQQELLRTTSCSSTVLEELAEPLECTFPKLVLVEEVRGGELRSPSLAPIAMP